MLDYYEYTKKKVPGPIPAKTKITKRKNTATAFYADKLHSASDQVTAAKKPKIAATVTSASVRDYLHTAKATDIVQNAAIEQSQLARAETTEILATSAVESNDVHEITLIEVAEENSTSEGEIENAGSNCVNVNCKKKVALPYL